MTPERQRQIEEWARGAALGGMFDGSRTDGDDEAYREDGDDTFEALDARERMIADLRRGPEATPEKRGLQGVADAEPDAAAVRAGDVPYTIEDCEKATADAHAEMVRYNRSMWRNPRG